MFTAPLPSNTRPIVKPVCCGNVFTEPLPSNGYTRYNTLLRGEGSFTKPGTFSRTMQKLDVGKKIREIINKQNNLLQNSGASVR
jgi:hypothetical protein